MVERELVSRRSLVLLVEFLDLASLEFLPSLSKEGTEHSSSGPTSRSASKSIYAQ